MSLPVSLNLSSIHCYDEADGIGSAEPYLWTIFFKIDGQTIQQSNIVSLSGQAVFHFGPGSHGNLPNHDVGAGDNVNIPDASGKWSTTLQPIVLKHPNGTTINVPGMVGVAAILLEEDDVSDSGAESGHQALNHYVQDQINQFIAGISLLDFIGAEDPQSKLSELLDALKEKIKKDSEDIVSNAIENAQGTLSNVWSWLNGDDKIGAEIWMFDQNEIVADRYTKSFSTRWKNQGDWEIFGNVSAPNPCQASLVAVNQKQQQINAAEAAIRQMQQEFLHATAAQKASIRKEIEEATQAIAPLRTEFTQLGQALNRCYLRQQMVVNTTGIDIRAELTHA